MNARTRIIETIDKPLGFFVLALFIVETFLVVAIRWSNLTGIYQLYVIAAGVGMFVYVTLIVAILVWCRAENLTFDKNAHLRGKRTGSWGTEKKPLKDIDSLPPEEKPK